MTETTLIAHEHVARAFADALRLFTGHGRRFSVQALAAVSGVRPRTVESYLCGQATPGWAAALSLAAVLPVEFLDAALLPTGRGAVDRAASADSHGHLLAQMAAVTAGFAEAMADGRIDHRERAALKDAAASLAVRLNGFVDGAAR